MRAAHWERREVHDEEAEMTVADCCSSSLHALGPEELSIEMQQGDRYLCLLEQE